MKSKKNVFSSLLLLLAGSLCFPALAQEKGSVRNIVKPEEVTTTYGPTKMVRTIIKDKKGSIWLASTEGMIRYDGGAFVNITGKAIPARFSSVLEDRKGNFWFGSTGSGVYYYDGRSFRNYTTKEGLANNRVTCIYEDKAGNIWFGTESGASRYDGRSFSNFEMRVGPPPSSSDSSHVSEVSPNHNDVNTIVEDRTGKLWFGTKGDASVYDGKTFTPIRDNEGRTFTNVRSMIKDKKGNIWLGGHDGLWFFNGSTFTGLIQNFVTDIYQDKKGNIWTGSESAKTRTWILSRYDEKMSSDIRPAEIKTEDNKEIFSITEANDGSIWFGSLIGVYHYDGKTITGFKNKDGAK